MITYSEELACQRELLIVRCASQRLTITHQGQALVDKLSAIDIGLNLLERLKSNPVWFTGMVAALIVIKPRRLLLAMQTGLLAWQTLRVLVPALRDTMGRYAQK